MLSQPAILAIVKDHDEGGRKLRKSIDRINVSREDSKMSGMDANSSTSTPPTNQINSIEINDAHIPCANSAKYPGNVFDDSLWWRVRVRRKREEYQIKENELPARKKLKFVNMQ